MLLKYLTIISSFNFLILSAILIFKKSALRKSNIVLGIVFIVMMLFSFDMFYLQHAYLRNSHKLLKYYIPLDNILEMLMGPGIYFYLKMILGQPIKIRKWTTYLHLLPVLPSLIYAIYFINLTEDVRVAILTNNFNSLVWQGGVLNGLFYLQMTVYLFVCYIIISKKTKESSIVIINQFQYDVLWLKTFFSLDILMMLITAPICFYIANDYVNTIIGQVVMNVQFIYIFFETVWRNSSLPITQLAETKISEKIEDAEFEPSLKLTEEQSDNYFVRLSAFMNEKKIYLQAGCTIQDVAAQSNIPQHHLSHILNNRLNKNFFDFINEYRVDTARQMLSSIKNQQLTIEAIGFECGFGSKTTFNKAFKKITNQTPSEFRKKNLLG